jgi:putative endonuclease
MAAHNELGKNGENLAVEFLLKKGYEIVSRNFIYQKAEVDIIARKGSTLAIIEVKTRSTPDFGNPQEFVKAKQIQNLVKAVDHFVDEHDLDVEVRFDIVAIIKNKAGTRLEHLEDAFLHFGQKSMI